MRLCDRGVRSWFVVCCVVFGVVCWCGIVLLVSSCVGWFDNVRVVLFPKMPDEGSGVDFGPCCVW